tara:strand:+ start:241 stop:1227 length:987 start_codon:yes stop_codon:yes gene_type:complete
VSNKKVRRSVVVGCGGYLPEKILSNEQLAEQLETSDQWIRARSGIEKRHIAAPNELTSDLGRAAAEISLRSAGMSPKEIDLVIVATSTPDQTFPATAAAVQAKVGANKAVAFDVAAVCSGFVFALATADNFIKSGQVNSALVIGAETNSRILDWEDRGTCVLFGDGAGSIVLKSECVEGLNSDRGILSTHLHSDGRLRDLLYVDGGPSSTGTVGYIRMEGKEVFRHAVVKMSEVVTEALIKNNLLATDIDWFVPHQANKRIIDGTAKKLGIDSERVVITIDKHANTSAASIPLALWEAVNDDKIKKDDLVLVEALGAGMTWGSGLIRW